MSGQSPRNLGNDAPFVREFALPFPEPETTPPTKIPTAQEMEAKFEVYRKTLGIGEVAVSPKDLLEGWGQFDPDVASEHFDIEFVNEPLPVEVQVRRNRHGGTWRKAQLRSGPVEGEVDKHGEPKFSLFLDFLKGEGSDEQIVNTWQVFDVLQGEAYVARRTPRKDKKYKAFTLNRSNLWSVAAYPENIMLVHKELELPHVDNLGPKPEAKPGV